MLNYLYFAFLKFSIAPACFTKLICMSVVTHIVPALSKKVVLRACIT